MVKCHYLRTKRILKLFKHKTINSYRLAWCSWDCCLFEVDLYSDCPSDVFYLLLSPIPSASLKVRSLIDLFCLNKNQGPLPLKSLVLLVIRSLLLMKNHNPLHMKKTWRVLKKHEHVYPPHRPNFWLVLKSNKIFIICKTKQEIGKRFLCEFAMARQAWFSTENSSLYCASELVFTTKLPFFLVFIFIFIVLCFFQFLFSFALFVLFASCIRAAREQVKEKH